MYVVCHTKNGKSSLFEANFESCGKIGKLDKIEDKYYTCFIFTAFKERRIIVWKN